MRVKQTNKKGECGSLGALFACSTPLFEHSRKRTFLCRFSTR